MAANWRSFRSNAARNCPEAVGIARSARGPAMRSASARRPAVARRLPVRMRGLPQVRQDESGDSSHQQPDRLRRVPAYFRFVDAWRIL